MCWAAPFISALWSHPAAPVHPKHVPFPDLPRLYKSKAVDWWLWFHLRCHAVGLARSSCLIAICFLLYNLAPGSLSSYILHRISRRRDSLLLMASHRMGKDRRKSPLPISPGYVCDGFSFAQHLAHISQHRADRGIRFSSSTQYSALPCAAALCHAMMPPDCHGLLAEQLLWC